MRCPKCGYTSFDNLERCKRCKKTISATATALMGTVLDAFPPSFLLASDEELAPPEELATASAGPSLAKESDAALNLAEATEEISSLDGGDADLRLSESNTEPAAPEPALDVDLNLPGAESSTASPTEDFSLEDLHIEDDMGLEKSPVPTAPASSTDGTRLSPSAKTGTALDGFNIEQLDDLLVADKAEKA